MKHHAGTCQNDPEDDCAVLCPGFAADTLEDLKKSTDKDSDSRKLLSQSDVTELADATFLWHIQRTLSQQSPASRLLLGPIDAAQSMGLGNSISGMMTATTLTVYMIPTLVCVATRTGAPSSQREEMCMCRTRTKPFGSCRSVESR